MANEKSSGAPSGKVQGEGDYEAARRYDKAARNFAESARVDDAARGAAPADADEAKAMEQAEQEGKSRSKGEDPAVQSGSSKS
jgi:hypothetical protein